MSRPFDIVTVADFDGSAPHRFEALSLLQLASVIEHGRAMRDVIPFHLACIGEPPVSVRRLADVAGARLSVHEPLLLDDDRFTNKLRAFEVDTDHDRRFVIDNDTLILGDLTPLGELPHGVAAAPGDLCKVPQRLWPKLYRGLGLDLPDHRMHMLAGELDMPARHPSKQMFPGQDDEVRDAFPYHNAGVVLASDECGLRDVWLDCIRRARELFDEPVPDIHDSDQAAFAIAVHVLRQRGVTFTCLPDRFHGRRQLFCHPTLRFDDMRLYHLIRGFSQLPPGPITPASWRAEMQRLERHYVRFFRMMLKGELTRGRVLRGLARHRRARAARRRLFGLIDRLFETHVRGVLDGA